MKLEYKIGGKGILAKPPPNPEFNFDVHLFQVKLSALLMEYGITELQAKISETASD